ncbi:ligand-binding sensor domain-containing protein [Spirosoma fluviale]|uniref:Two component regulator propeller n=1 Tax=Spirosoma fluviale TaxID=1597977 RepID=A0A286GNA5_9BACT|nr:sensor histidine kinase [Spirosoma fluviale]SOD97008.1 Two component regulator propeller [Spirosoma fluviale]
MRILLCICIQVIICCQLHQTGQAQAVGSGTAPVFRVDHIGVRDGLTQGSVYYMLKDSRGFLWFGTQDGLNRYDGRQFRTYRPALGKEGAVVPGSIRGINIFGIVEDPDGNLWIGTEEGLNRYDRQRDRFDCFFANRPGASQKRLASRILPFFVDTNELLYLSDAEGLVQYQYRTQRKTVLASVPHLAKEYDLQSSTVRTPSGDVWLHASTGLMRYNIRNRTLSRYFSDHPDNQFGSVQNVFSFFVDADDIAWIGTGNGLIRFDHRRKMAQTYQTVGTKLISEIYSIASDQRSQLWLGTQSDGVLYFDKRSRLFGQVNRFTQDSRQLSELKISKVYVDRQGMIWANMDPDGLARIVPNAFLFGGLVKAVAYDTLSANQKLSSYTVRGFMEERFDRLWVLTENGINVFNPRTNRIVERFLTRKPSGSGLVNPQVRCLYRDPKRQIWLGVRGGVLVYSPTASVFESIRFESSIPDLPTDDYVRNLVSISDTVLIAATESGLYALNTQRRLWSKVSTLANQNVFSLYYNSLTRQLWVGTFLNGYYCYQLDGANKAWRFVQSGLKGYTILNIRPDDRHPTLWLSSDRGLVNLTDKSNRFRLYTERQGLANSFVYGTLSDADNNIWMSTNRGISRLDPSTQMIKNFMPNDGLQGYEFNGNAFLKTASGELYFGGVSGFNRCLPNMFRPSSYNPYVSIHSLNINEEPFMADTYVGEARRIRLRHTQNTLSLEFAALDYASNGHNSYQYQLSKYDDHWVMAGERNYVRYANLPPGAYTFQVKAANQDGHWSVHIRTLAIYIEPPFWRKGPFVILVLLILAALVWVWIIHRENAIRTQQADRVRLAYDIQEQVKKEIARDIHDEIGTRLATIKLYTTQLTQLAGETPGILALKATIFQLINDTIGDVRNMLRKLNPQTLERHGYIAAVDELFSRITASGIVHAQYSLDGISEQENRLLAEVEVMLYRITQELVSNSLKHANATMIDLSITQMPNRIVLVYQDNGRGFNYEQTQKKASGLGIGNIESRVAILGGHISWKSQVDKGVQATIDVPVRPLVKHTFSAPQSNLPLSG